MFTDNDQTELARVTVPERQESQKPPIKDTVWEAKPTGPVGESIKKRLSEFFSAPEIPPATKALGLLSIELVTTASKELESANFTLSLYHGEPYLGEPTIYRVVLEEDKIVLFMSPLGSYGEFVEAAGFATEQLDNATGNVSAELAKERPDLVYKILSADTDPKVKCQAKTDLFRFLAGVRPDRVKKLSDLGGFDLNIGVAYAMDDSHPALKLYVNEIPDSDEKLGEAAKVLEAMNLYRKVAALTNEEFAEMTTDKIELLLKSLPPLAQRILMGEYPEPGHKAFRILEFLEKFGYSGNKAQQKWRLSQQITMALTGATPIIRGKVLDCLVKDQSAEEVGLNHQEIDRIFREEFDQNGGRQLPPDFSISKVVLDQIPLEELGI